MLEKRFGTGGGLRAKSGGEEADDDAE